MVTEADAAAIARFNRIATTPERLADLAAEFTAVNALIVDLDSVPGSGTGEIPGPFDPAWDTATPDRDAR